MRRICFAAAVAGTSISLLANEANYQTYLVGDRAVGMGGAVCAVAESADACFYNPAGLVRVARNSVSLSGNAYGLQQTYLRDWLYPGEDADISSVVSIPTSFSVVRLLNPRWAVGFSAFVPLSIQYNQMDSYPATNHFYNYSVRDESLWVGPSLAWRKSEKLSLGATLFLTHRSYARSQNLLWGNYATAYSDALQYSAFGVQTQIGLQYRPDDRWNLGLTARAPGITLGGSGRFHQYRVVGIPEVAGEANLSAENLDANESVPGMLKAGIAWTHDRTLTLALDLTCHLPARYNRLEGEYFGQQEPATLKEKREAVLDANLGAEYWITPAVPLRFGFFTSHSSAPDVNPDAGDYPAQIDLYGLTGSVGLASKDRSFSLAVNYASGSGTALGWDVDPSGRFVVTKTDAEETHLYVIVSAAYYY